MEKVVNKISHKKMVVCRTAGMVILNVFAFTLFARGQNLLEQKVYIKAGQIKVDYLFKEIRKQTGAEFSFNSNKITPSRTLTAGNEKRSVSAWLQLIERTFNVNYKLVGNHIILIDQKITIAKGKTVTYSKKTNTGTDKIRASSKIAQKKSAEENLNKVNTIVRDITLYPSYSSLTVAAREPIYPTERFGSITMNIQILDTTKTLTIGDVETIKLVHPTTSSDAFENLKETNNRFSPASNTFFLSAELKKTKLKSDSFVYFRKGLSLVYNRELSNSNFGLGAGIEFIDISTKKLGGIMPSFDVRYYVKSGKSTFIPLAQLGYNFWTFRYTKLNSTEQYEQKGGTAFSVGVGYSYSLTTKGGGPYTALKFRSMQYRYTDPLLPRRHNLNSLNISIGWRF